MRNELQRHKKSDKIKWTLTAVAFVLFAVLLAGVCLQVFGSGKVKPSEWFRKDDKAQAEQERQDTDPNEFFATDFVSSGTENAVKICATMKATTSNNMLIGKSTDYQIINVNFVPENTTFKQIKYSVNFLDPDSTWAKDKNAIDYISILLRADGATGEVYCLAPFSEPIIITAAWVLNENVKATCICTYVQKIVSTDFIWSENACSGLPLRGNVQLECAVSLDEDYIKAFDRDNISFESSLVVNPEFIELMPEMGIINVPTKVKRINLINLNIINTTEKIGFTKTIQIDGNFWQNFFGSTIFNDAGDMDRLRRLIGSCNNSSRPPLFLNVGALRGGSYIFNKRIGININETTFTEYAAAISVAMPNELEL